MRTIKLSFFVAVCSCLVLLTACSSFDDIFSSKQDHSSGLPVVTENDDLIEFDSDSDVLPERPAKAWAPVAGLNFPTIYFAHDQSRIGTAQVKKLEAVAHYLEKHQNLGVIIEGHCDERGSAEYNIGLGERRALSALDYLENLGVPSTRLQTISYGSERPEALEHNHTAWVKNRRAELIPAKR